MDPRDSEKSRASRIIVFCTIVGAVAAVLSVPEARRIIGLDSRSSNHTETGAATSASPTAEKASTVPSQKSKPPQPKDRYAIRIFNCDDAGRALLNGRIVADVGFGDDSGWIDVTEQLEPGINNVRFQVINKEGAITYGFQVRKNSSIAFTQECGIHHRIGCEDNRQDFPAGVSKEFNFNISFP
jgi:hypothetical protein